MWSSCPDLWAVSNRSETAPALASLNDPDVLSAQRLRYHCLGDLLSHCHSLHCLQQNMMKYKPMREKVCLLQPPSGPLSPEFPAGLQDIFCLLSSPNQPGHSGGEQARPVSLLASKENRNMIHFSARIARP